MSPTEDKTSGGRWRAWMPRVVWLLWGVVCFASLGLEIESPLYPESIDWVYWGQRAEPGWRSSSLARWLSYHLVLFAAPGLGYAGLRRLVGGRKSFR